MASGGFPQCFLTDTSCKDKGCKMQIESRKYPRHPSWGKIRYSVAVSDVTDVKHVRSTATTLNASEDGACIKTPFPLEAGHVLRISQIQKIQLSIVKWVKRERAHYVAGIKKLTASG
jgi:hypothetical protein